MQKRNNISRRSLMIMVLAVAATLVAGTVLAQGSGRHAGARSGSGCGSGDMAGPGMGCGFGSGHRLELLAERLELTEDQITAIKDIREKGQEKNIGLRKELMQLNHELKGEMLKDDPSEKTALDLMKKIGAVKTEMESGRLQNRLEVRKQLTPEQRDKMLMVQERSHRGRGGKGHHGGGRGGRGRGHGDCDNSGSGRGIRAQGKDL